MACQAAACAHVMTVTVAARARIVQPVTSVTARARAHALEQTVTAETEGLVLPLAQQGSFAHAQLDGQKSESLKFVLRLRCS